MVIVLGGSITPSFGKLISGIASAVFKSVQDKRTPKAKAIRELMKLNNALISCQNSFDSWNTTEKEIENTKEYLEWRKAVTRLVTVYERIEKKLGIFAPGLEQNIKLYLTTEVLHYNARTPNDIDMTLKYNIPNGRAHTKGDISNTRNCNDSSKREEERQKRDIEKALECINASYTFTNAISDLREFIKSNFKIEDLYI